MRPQLKEDPGFENFEADQDPLRLWTTLAEVSVTGRVAKNAVKKRQDAKDRFAALRQWYTESVYDFYERFNEMEALTSAGVDEDDDAEIAMAFLNKLDKRRF